MANPFAGTIPALMLIWWPTSNGIEFILYSYFNLAQADNVGDQFVGLFFVFVSLNVLLSKYHILIARKLESNL